MCSATYSGLEINVMHKYALNFSYLFITTKIIELVSEDNEDSRKIWRLTPRTLRNTSLSFSRGICKSCMMPRPSLRTVLKMTWNFKCEKKSLVYSTQNKNLLFVWKSEAEASKANWQGEFTQIILQNQQLDANLLTSSPNRGVTDNSLPGNKA